MARWLAAVVLAVVASAAGAADTGVRLVITGLPTLPPGSGPVKLVDVLRQAAGSLPKKPQETQLVVTLAESQLSPGAQVRVTTSGTYTQVQGNTVACF
ncbi:MAG: hypothetical protein ACP5NF_05645 [Thermoanaerobaculum sp.]